LAKISLTKFKHFFEFNGNLFQFCKNFVVYPQKKDNDQITKEINKNNSNLIKDNKKQSYIKDQKKMSGESSRPTTGKTSVKLFEKQYENINMDQIVDGKLGSGKESLFVSNNLKALQDL